MKIRLDFVTNSSSSSFTCVALYSKELYDFLQELIKEKKYVEQPEWCKNLHPQNELHLDCAWESLSFDKRWNKVQTTEEGGDIDKESICEYVSNFFTELTNEEEEALRDLVFKVYEDKDYQTKKFKDYTDGFVGFDFNELKKAGPEKKKITKESSFDNPEYDYFKERVVDLCEIDLKGKTVGLHVVDLLQRDDKEHEYYGKHGTAYDIASAVIEKHFGGKVTKSVSSITDYVVISNRMRVQDGADIKTLAREYEEYSLSQKRLKDMIIDGDTKRAKKKKAPIGIVFEDEFYNWLHDQYDTLKVSHDYFKPYAVLFIRLEPFDDRGWRCWSYKSEYLTNISKEVFEQFLGESNSVNELVSNIESYTKEGCFSICDSAIYEDMMGFVKADTFKDYEKMVFKYNSTDGNQYQIVIEAV